MKLTSRKKLIIYKVLLFAFAFVIAFMPSTAERNREVNRRVIVEMVGIDASADGGVELTAQYVMPTETDGATSKDKITVSADTVAQAAEMLTTSLGRRAELGHCSMVIMGDGALPEHISSLVTDTDITADVYLAAAEKKASELISSLTDFMKKTGATDADFIAYGAKKSHIATNTLLGFLSDIGSKSETAFAPIVEMIEEKSSGGESSGGGSDGGSSDGNSGGSSSSSGSSSESGGSSGDEKSDSGMKVEKLALYGSDGRVGILNSTAARGVAWTSSPVQNSVVAADGVTGRLVRKKASIDVDGDNMTATVKIKATIDSHSNLYKGADANFDMKKAFEEAIERELTSGYTAALELGKDPMFVMRELYRYAPDAAENAAITDMSVDFVAEVVVK